MDSKNRTDLDDIRLSFVRLVASNPQLDVTEIARLMDSLEFQLGVSLGVPTLTLLQTVKLLNQR